MPALGVHLRLQSTIGPTDRSREFCSHGAVGHPVEQGGWACLPALGEGAAGDWPPEESLLVLGIQAAEALALAKQFDQAALLLGTLGEPVRLAWTDS